ncbi:hypothetical protein [Aeromicrobium alkaliterrae]|uniref:hypothetical protein n=1 Tax=Aeromicrobium alkaliterrae TaxID=302168 RepID=UPI0031DB4733
MRPAQDPAHVSAELAAAEGAAQYCEIARQVYAAAQEDVECFRRRAIASVLADDLDSALELDARQRVAEADRDEAWREYRAAIDSLSATMADIAAYQALNRQRAEKRPTIVPDSPTSEAA